MLIEPLFAHARENPNQIIIIDDQGRYTASQAAAMAAGLGFYLKAQTNKPRVGLLLPSGIGFVASFYGTLLAGKSVVPINFLLGDREIAHVIKDSGIDTVVTIPFLAARLHDASLKIIDLTALPKTPPDLTPQLPQSKTDDEAVLMYTSGTSGVPKGVILTYANLQSDVDAAIVAAALQRRHHFLGMIPLFHSFGMTAMMLAPIQLGSLVVYIGRFSPVAAVNAIREHGISLMFGVPSMFWAILNLKNATADDFKAMYAIITGGEPLPPPLREGFKARFQTTLYEGYGLTETSPVVALNVPQSNKPGSVGKPLSGVQVRLVDDDGQDMPPGASGEVWLKGPMIMKGYHNLPLETAAALTSEGFFKTGDLGMIDTDGFLHITGRKKDLIIVAGEKVVPREIEDVLMLHPAVQEAAVVGKAEASRGQMVVAFIVERPGQRTRPDEIREFCRQRGLVLFKIPREIIVLKEFPRSGTGKILKRVLIEQAAAKA